eukprot:2404965-Pleurochrysis_carterae.AAC.1
MRRWIGLALAETPLLSPREEGALPSAACLSHAINRLLDATDARLAVGAQSGVPRGRVTKHNLSLLELALQVCGDEIPATHVHAVGGGDGG